MKASIFGLGYVGSVGMACLSQNGHTIIGVDVNHTKVDFVNSGKAPIVEKDVDVIFEKQHRLKRISATMDPVEAVLSTQISFVCVGTPSTANGHLNLEAIYKVAEQIADGIAVKSDFHVVVIRSTVVPGTNVKVSSLVEARSGKRKNVDFAVVSNPEFLREGTAVKDFFNPPYTLIGTENQQAADLMRQIYDGIEAPFIYTDIRVAEIIKYINNAYHALKISFANEVGNVCKALNVDSHKVMDIFCKDKKLNISPAYFKPGFAYGGSCLPKDLKALRTIAHDNYLECPIIENIERSNEIQKEQALKKIIEIGKRKVGFLGIAFKSGTDDLRSSPIIDVIEQLLGKGFNIKVYDRHVHLSQLVGANREYILNKIPLISQLVTDDLKTIIDHSEVIVVVNNEPELRTQLQGACGEKIVFDLVRVFDDSISNDDNYIGLSW